RHEDGRTLPARLSRRPQDLVPGLHGTEQWQARANRLGPLSGRVAGGSPWEGTGSARPCGGRAGSPQCCHGRWRDDRGRFDRRLPREVRQRPAQRRRNRPTPAEERRAGDRGRPGKDLVVLGGVNLLFGAPKNGKSFIAISIACAVQAGVSWCGFLTRKLNVLYVGAEGFYGLLRREAAWSKLHGVAVEIHYFRTPINFFELVSVTAA